MKLPLLGTSITLYSMSGSNRKMMTVLPNKEPGRALAYLNFIAPRWHVGPCVRATIRISRIENVD